MNNGKIHLLFQTVFILAGMGGLFGLLGWMIFGNRVPLRPCYRLFVFSIHPKGISLAGAQDV